MLIHSSNRKPKILYITENDWYMILFTSNQQNIFTFRLADIPIKVHTLYSQTKIFCREYLTDESPVISISICSDDIRKEQNLDADKMEEEGHHQTWHSSSYFETLALCRKIMAELIKQNVMLFHGAVMAVNGKANLFTAKSGTGKTTHCFAG